MAGLIDKKVFSWVPLSEVEAGQKVLTTRWVYDLKVNERGEIVREKARIVVRGYEQREGVEYSETFAATARMDTIRMILSIAAEQRLTLSQFDILQAFLESDLDGEVLYVHPPPGYGRPGEVWKLHRGLYGLKQAANLFSKHFSNILVTKLGMKRMKSDSCCYVLRRTRANGKTAFLICSIWVDDGLIASSDDEIRKEFMDTLAQHIGVKDLGRAKWLLGLHIKQDPHTFDVEVNQEQFVTDLLQKVGLGGEAVRSKSTPAPAGQVLSKIDCPTEGSPEKREMGLLPYSMYRSVVGSLMYLVGGTRPDCAVAVNHLSRFSSNPGKPHWDAMVWLLRYLHGTRALGISYIGNHRQGVILEEERRNGAHVNADDAPSPRMLSESFRCNLVAYTDSDWGSCVDTRRSTTGYVIFMNGGPISWCCKRQPVTSTSSAEAEFYSLSACVQQLRWSQQLSGELGFVQPMKRPGRNGYVAGSPMYHKNLGNLVWEDNAGAIAITQNDVFHQRTKHIDIKYHFVLDYVEQGFVSVRYANTKDNIADVMTKCLPGPAFVRFRNKLMGAWHATSSSAR